MITIDTKKYVYDFPINTLYQLEMINYNYKFTDYQNILPKYNKIFRENNNYDNVYLALLYHFTSIYLMMVSYSD